LGQKLTLLMVGSFGCFVAEAGLAFESVAQIKKSAQSAGISSTRIDDVDKASNATTLTLLA
jgi:hypothetical protein